MRAKLGIAGVLALAVVGIGWYVWSVRAMDEAKKRAHARLQVPSAPTVEGASPLAPPGAPPTGSAIGAKPTAANDPRSQADRAAAAACRCLNDNTEGAVIRATCVQELRENPSPVSTLCLRAFVDDPESEKLLVGMKSEDPTPEQEIILDAHNALMAKGRELKTLRSIGAAPPGPPPAGPPQDSPKLKPPPPSPD